MNRRAILLAFLLIGMGFSLIACKPSSDTPTAVTERFFSAFASADYETMKAYCTEECVKSYFHNGDVNGMVWAKLTECGDEEIADDAIVHIFVSVEMETAETSALYPETQTSFYVELIRNNDDLWLIKGFFTGGIEKRRKL